MGLEPSATQNGNGSAPKTDYYNSGSNEPAQTSKLVLKRLESRRQLTKNSNRLVIVLVGLPARGKSFVARKLLNFLEWYGCECKIFNVGKYRRQANAEATDSTTGACDANFFDTNNKEAAALRERVATIALEDMLRWLDDDDNDSDDDKEDSSRRSCGSTFGEPKGDRIAIFDATNSTNKRRQWILEECTSPAKRPGKPTGCVFVESICDDEELIMENFRFKISNSPDYKGMDETEALTDLRNRVAKYEAAYETIADDSLSYIKIFNLSTKLLVNHIYGRMSKVIVPALMAWNIGTRPIFLCRPGQTLSDVSLDSDDYVSKSNVNLNDSAYLNLSISSKKRLTRGDRLGPTGKKFSDALYDFVFEEGMDFLLKRSSIMDMAQTGTSVSGLATFQQGAEDSGRPPFPIKVFTSTMPRAAETVRWEEYDFKIEELSNLNPLDKGDFAGKELEELQETHPSWYQKLERNPFSTRFPGGESYKDLIKRLETVVVDLEQQVIPTLIVSHVSVLQLLIAYFRKTSVKDCMHIEVPLHTVLKFTPARGGGWTETQVPLSPVFERANSTLDDTQYKFEGLDKVGRSQSSNSVTNQNSLSTATIPIWGDHMKKNSSLSLGASGHGHHVQF